MSYLDSIVLNQYLEPDLKPYEALIADLRTKLKQLPGFKYWKKILDQHLLLILQNLHLVYQMSPKIYVAYSRNKNNYSKPDLIGANHPQVQGEAIFQVFCQPLQLQNISG